MTICPVQYLKDYRDCTTFAGDIEILNHYAPEGPFGAYDVSSCLYLVTLKDMRMTEVRQTIDFHNRLYVSM